MSIHHLRGDIRGMLLNWDDRLFRGMFKHDDGRPMEPREAKLVLMDQLGFDPFEKGCPGHISESVAEDKK